MIVWINVSINHHNYLYDHDHLFRQSIELKAIKYANVM